MLNSDLVYSISSFLSIPIIFIILLSLKNIDFHKLDGYNSLLILCICLFVFDILSNISYTLQSNNHWLNYIYIPVEFGLLVFYMQSFRNNPFIKYVSITIITLFTIFQLLLLFNDKFNQSFDYLGFYINTPILIIFSLWNLTHIYKKSYSSTINHDPNFWFHLTILFLNVVDMIIGVMVVNNFGAGEDGSFTILFSIRNTIRAILFLGYLKGFLLLKN